MDLVGIGEPEHGQRQGGNDPEPPRRVDEASTGSGKDSKLSEHEGLHPINVTWRLARVGAAGKAANLQLGKLHWARTLAGRLTWCLPATPLAMVWRPRPRPGIPPH